MLDLFASILMRELINMPDCHCSRCGRQINDVVEKRFVVRLDVTEAENKLQPILPDRDTDPLEMMTQIIMNCQPEREEDTAGGELTVHFVICSDCHNHLLENPFGLKNSRKIRFSLN